MLTSSKKLLSVTPNLFQGLTAKQNKQFRFRNNFGMTEFVVFVLFFLFLASSITIAQNKQLTFNQVYMFSEPRILKPLPRLQGWFDDDHYLLQKRDGTTSAIIKVNAKTEEETILLDFNSINPNLDEAELTAEENIGITKDYTGLLFYNDNDLFFYSLSQNKLTRLTNDKHEEVNPMLSPDGKKVAYTKKKIFMLLMLNRQKKHA